MGANGAGGGYNLENSLRFRSSAGAYLNRTPTVAGNRQTWTWSAWVKRGSIGSLNQALFMARTDSANQLFFLFDAGEPDTLEILQLSSNVANARLVTTPVFRDPSAWYHIILVYDTTNATANDRVKIYVNGKEITSFTFRTNPTLNYAGGHVNSTIPHSLGSLSTSHFDGYLTEVNFVDGQALTPSDFGDYNEDTGVWQPKEYEGTYGTNGFYLPFENKSAATYINTFNGSSQSLSVVGSADMALGSGDCTVECYFKVDSLVNYRSIIDNRAAAGSGTGFSIDVDANGSIYNYSNGFIVQSANGTISPGVWYHVAYTKASGTHRLFVNGVQVATSTATTDYTNDDMFIGRAPYGGEWFDGEISNVRIVKGTAVYTSNFTPAITNLTAVTNTKLLTCQSSTIVDNSGLSQTIVNEGTVAASLGNPFRGISVTSDQSGNINNWVSNNINLDSSTATTYDIMTDVPTLTDEDTANYAVLNPLASNSVSTLSNANLDVTASTVYYNERATIELPSSGKWYFECYLNTVDCVMGVMKSSIANNAYMGFSTDAWAFLAVSGNKSNGSAVSYASASAAGQTIGIAMNMDNGELTFYRLGASLGVAYTIADTSNLVFGIGQTTNALRAVNANFGQRPFKYTPPAGYKKLNTFNLPDSSIVDGSENFNTVLYTGNGGTNTITGVGFEPDLVWIKNRSSANSHQLVDSVRGATKHVFSNTTDQEYTYANGLTSFNTDGFSIGNLNDVNNASYNYVGWCWDAGSGSPVSNTYGTITSTVKANPATGFSVATYTGTGVAGSIGHGLGVVPKLYIIKQRTDAGNNWIVQTTAVDGSLDYLFLNATNAKGNSGDALPTSSVINISGNNDVNGSGDGIVAYCFADVEGYSKIGSYTGNGSTNGPFVYTGFKPAFVMVKTYSAVGNWFITDAARDPSNVATQRLFANLSNAEDSSALIDLTSNGFKLRMSSALNDSANYIFMAFAENPFKNSLAR